MLRDDVREFMLASGQHIAERPSVPPPDVVRLRLRLLLEEFGETLSACIDTRSQRRNQIEFALWHLHDAINSATLCVDLVAYADGLADLLYVAHGNALAHGIDLDAVCAEVARSNATKLIDPIVDETGKVRKGPSYEPPRIAEVLGVES